METMTYNFLSPRRKVSFSAWVHLPHLLSPLAPLYLLCFLSLLLSIPIVRSTCYSCSVDYWWLAKGGCFLVRQFSGFERWIGWKWNKADYDCSSMVKQRYVFDGLCDICCVLCEQAVCCWRHKIWRVISFNVPQFGCLSWVVIPL